VRNWNLLIAVDGNGKTVWTTGVEGPPTGLWGKDSPHCPHTPVMLDNGNIIISEPINGRVVEWDPKKEEVIWSYPVNTWRDGGPYYFVRAAHRLPNGNTFIIDSLGQFLEVTSEGEVVWHARLADYRDHDMPPTKEEIFRVPCFNADRRGMSYYGGR
jgi:outer membrane protein assembly factor BamB